MNAVASPLQSDQELRVLNTSLSARLVTVNEAHRALSARGYHLVRQDLRLGTAKRPLLTLDRGNEDLRSELSQIRTGIGDDGAFVMGKFMDVDVCWIVVPANAELVQ
jgi:hypothetical protein